MNSLDKHYLSLQFSNKIFKKNGAEFQRFFENIMEKAFSDFRKIRPRGKEGDGGNDGYRKDVGIYYQVYAPNEPKVNETKAARKIKEDFEKLKKEWDEISEVKEYCFVYNDKYSGSTQKLERTISELEQIYPNIKFRLFLAKDLEKIFFSLDESSILDLGFNIDSRQAVKNAYLYLEHVKVELDKENAVYAYKILKNINEIILSLKDENLFLEYEILECKCLQKLEKIDEAKAKYETILERYSDDPRAPLYLAEIYLLDNDLNKNLKLLEEAEKIDKNFWLLKLEKLLRKNFLRTPIDSKNIEESSFPDDPKIKSKFYRMYATFFENEGKRTIADSFIEKAIHLNPENFNNYIVKLSILEERLLVERQEETKLIRAKELLEEVRKVEDKFMKYGDIGYRNKAILNVKKLSALRVLEDFSEFEKIAKETFELFLNCYFNNQIEQNIIMFLRFVSLPDDDLRKLLEYIISSKKEISDELSKSLILQFNIKNKLLSDGKDFFIKIGNQKYIDFLSFIENKNYEKILKFLKNDTLFTVSFVNTLKSSPKLRRKIIKNLPNDENISKEKLLLLLNFDEKEFDEAFSILKKLDLSKLSYFECKPILEIVEQKEAWDFAVVILQKLIEKEKDEEQKFNLQLRLFNAYLKLGKYLDVIALGRQLIRIEFGKNYLDRQNKEALLSNTIIALLERGKVDDKYYIEAKKILENYQLAEPSFEFKVRIEAEVYLLNKDPQKALKTVVEGVKIKKMLSPKEYEKLYFLLVIKIGNKTKLNLDSLGKVKKNIFVKLKNKDKWYFIGNNNELDAIPIRESNNKYSIFINKKLGETVVFENKYSTERHEDFIEKIFPIEKYILWQVIQNFQKLSKDGDLEGVQMIEVPQKGETIDIKNLLKLMEELSRETEPFFETYCKNGLPLAMLAVSEGGLTNAIARIQNEQKGFVNFSTGIVKDFEEQKEVARTIIKQELPFYIDGTSALFLSEIGYLSKIYKYITSVRVPQSVINLLAKVIKEKFIHTEGHVGYMSYSQGKINFSTIDKEKIDLIRNNFINSIKLLESNANNIKAISYANKADCFSEQKVPPELSDACILAQNENTPILTEDFLYLKMNEIETKKKSPKYFSSLALMRIFYEEKKITFDEYLDYFRYLSLYRFRFLPLNSNDIEKAVFGDREIEMVNWENIRKFNFSLTLSEEYGVRYENAIGVIGIFFYKVLCDNTITEEILEKIFVEIIDSFPHHKNKMFIGQDLLYFCIKLMEKEKKKRKIVYYDQKYIYKRINKLFQLIKIFNFVERNE